MLIEMLNGSGKIDIPLARTGIPVASKLATPRHGIPPEVQEKPALQDIDIASLVTDAQMNLDAMHDVALNFSIHESSGRTVITVADENTGEIIREIPSTEFLKLAAKLNEMAGVLFDQKG